jgi:hypothetical protein
MPLDHYVSQVHLKNFCSPEDGLLRAIRKSDLKSFRTKSQDICRIEDGSTNEYLKEARVIEEFLKDVEPRYNASVQKLREDKFDQECIFCIAGFVAYVVTCSPAAMRIHSGPLKANLESTAKILDAQGVFSKAPEALGEKSLTELLADGTVKFEVDQKYPQAMGVANVEHHVSVFGNSTWEILHNRQEDNAFFTSDFPAAIEVSDLNTPINRIVPLAPNLAIRIIPDINLSGTKPDLTFAKFRAGPRAINQAEIRKLNRLIVQCAEDLILYRDDHQWVERLVAKNRLYRVEPVTQHIPHGTGILDVSTQRILSHAVEASPV